jgi:hypothetical protein
LLAVSFTGLKPKNTRGVLRGTCTSAKEAVEWRRNKVQPWVLEDAKSWKNAISIGRDEKGFCPMSGVFEINIEHFFYAMQTSWW